MRLAGQECWERLAAARHGVLSTVHDERGVDCVPVVFAVIGGAIVVPIDTVKPKATANLQRQANLQQDDRCSFLVDHYDDDWSALWWVRVHGRARVLPPDERSVAALSARYEPYREPGAIASTIVLMPAVVLGWTATRSE